MGKNNKKGKKRSGGGGGEAGGSSKTTIWDGADHVMRKHHQANKKAKKQQRQEEELEEEQEPPRKFQKQQVKEERRHRLTEKLTHDSKDKREASKLRLNIIKTQRDIDRLRPRLEKWDDAGEKAQLQKQQEAEAAPPKKKGRLGPESWKLKGAARPAWLVNEMDVRYVCPHQKAHDDANAKAKRVRNLLALLKGKFGQEVVDHNNNDVSYPHRRHFLALLMQNGLLNMEAKKYKTARLAFLECLELDGIHNPITDARCYLMRLYLQVNRPQSVHQLWTTRLAPTAGDETSVWVLYSVALVEYIRWKLFEEGSRREAEQALVRAMQGNVLCAYYLAFEEFFHEHMEYTDEVEHAENPLEETIEYCDSEQMGMWIGTDGALEWVQATLLRALHGQKVADGALSMVDLEWAPKLLAVEDEFKVQQQEEQAEQEAQQQAEEDAAQDKRVQEVLEGKESCLDDDDDDDEHSEEEEEPEDQVDTLMYAGMFRTTMEMLYASGALAQAPPAEVEEEALDTIAEDAEEDDESGGSHESESDDDQ